MKKIFFILAISLIFFASSGLTTPAKAWGIGESLNATINWLHNFSIWHPIQNFHPKKTHNNNYQDRPAPQGAKGSSEDTNSDIKKFDNLTHPKKPIHFQKYKDDSETNYDSESIAPKPTTETTENTPPTNKGFHPGNSECKNNSSIREYNCPQLVEYEFPGTVRYDVDGHLVAFFAAYGPPILRLNYAELQNDDMACVYEDAFAAPDGIQLPESDHYFAYVAQMSGQCPGSLTMRIRNKEKVAPNWKLLEPGYIKIDKFNHAKIYVTGRIMSHDGRIYGAPGCVYNSTLQPGSDPTLRQKKHGYCVVNDTKDGFLCADSVTEMYGDGADQTHSISVIK